MLPIRETVQSVIKDLEKKLKEQDTKTLALLKKNLTKQERLHIKLVSLRQDELVVNVDSSAWLYQLNQKKEQLETQLGVKNIRFRLGETG
jgi:Ulp1 family protease